MSKPPVIQTTNPTPHHAHDDHSGAFGFFRRYQKAILYTAGLFTLLTFSISTAMLDLFGGMFREKIERPTIEVAGRRVNLQDEDYHWALQISRAERLPPVCAMPMLGPEDNDGDRQETYAILRRASIENGLDVSEDEVERALEFTCSSLEIASVAELARQLGQPSPRALRQLSKEIMRIGNFVRLQALAIDGTDAAALAVALKDKEKITLRAASFDVKALQEELQKAGGIDEAGLRKFLEGKDEVWKNTHAVYDTNHVALQIGALMTEGAEGQVFDAAQWTEELTTDVTGEDRLKQVYEEEKERFKVDPAVWDQQGRPRPAPEAYPFEDEAVQTTLKRLAQAEEVANVLLRKIREQRDTATKDTVEALKNASIARNEAQIAYDKAKTAADAAPADQALAATLAECNTKLEETKKAMDAAEQAMKTAREAFDFGAAFTGLAKGRAGAKVIDLPEPRNGDGLKELPELGKWGKSYLATSLQVNGEISSIATRAQNGAFLFKITQLSIRPLKSWDELKKVLEEQYFAEQAKQQGEDKKKAMAQKLLELAKAKLPEKVAELEAKKAGQVDERMQKWLTDTQKALDAAEKNLSDTLAGTVAHDAWLQQKQKLADQLAKQDEQRTAITEAVAKDIEAEIQKEAKAKYGEVIADAAAQCGFTMTAIPPVRRDLTTVPRFDKVFDAATVFLVRGEAGKLKQGEATDALEDVSNRKWFFAVCDKVEPLAVADLTRRDFAAAQADAANVPLQEQRSYGAFQQAFTLDAVKKRYQYEAAKKAPAQGAAQK